MILQSKHGLVIIPVSRLCVSVVSAGMAAKVTENSNVCSQEPVFPLCSLATLASGRDLLPNLGKAVAHGSRLLNCFWGEQISFISSLFWRRIEKGRLSPWSPCSSLSSFSCQWKKNYNKKWLHNKHWMRMLEVHRWGGDKWWLQKAAPLRVWSITI